MAIDIEHLKRHYAGLSDDALLALDRDELVEEARKCLDEEIASRGVEELPESDDAVVDDGDEEAPAPSEINTDWEGAEAPEWIEESAMVFSAANYPGASSDPIANACAALLAANIPCFVQTFEIDPPNGEWRVLVPDHQSYRAMSVLERDLFNVEFEEGWKTHLELLSDHELREMNPRYSFCGLFDKIERVVRTYNEELNRRGLKA